MISQFDKIAVKIGSNVLTRDDGTLDITRMSALVDQLALLWKAGVSVILISSGAVASGRGEIHAGKRLDSVSQRQLYSAVGQVKLINRYYELFREHCIPVGQVLTTKESFSTRGHYLNQRNCMMAMLDNGVLPIVNENDAVSVTELMFTDNDELSGLIASMMNAQALIILSNVDGVYDGSLSDENARLIRNVEPDDDLSQYIQPGKSCLGRGGMWTKLHIAQKVAGEGIAVFIANGKRENVLTGLLQCPEGFPCTFFHPAPQGLSSIKKWIAHSGSFAKGALHVDGATAEAIRDGRVLSILPVGVVRIEGKFEREDIVRVLDGEGRQIAIGRSNLSSSEAAEVLGKHGQKPIVHYDYLYWE